MLALKRPRVKICCISSMEEARLAIRYGASALGLVSEMPSGPGVISESKIAEIARIIPPPIGSFLLTCKQNTREIIAQQKRAGVNTLQLCDRLLKGSYKDFREELPGISIVQVIHVRGEESIEEALSLAMEVDAILLDSGNPVLEIKELGGTGRVHNWEISRKIRELSNIPVFLAGGLNSDNVRNAIEQVGPFGLDLCNGVRTNGKLDEGKLRVFMERARE